LFERNRRQATFLVTTRQLRPCEQLRHHFLKNSLFFYFYFFTFLAIVSALDKAIDCHLKGTGLSPSARHEFIQRTYNWTNIANRTELVYDNVHHQPVLTTGQLLRKYETIPSDLI